MRGKENGKWLAEGHGYYCFVEGYSIYLGTAPTLILSEGKKLTRTFLIFVPLTPLVRAVLRPPGLRWDIHSSPTALTPIPEDTWRS